MHPVYVTTAVLRPVGEVQIRGYKKGVFNSN